MAPYSEKSNLQIHLPSAAETAERNAKTPKVKFGTFLILWFSNHLVKATIPSDIQAANAIKNLKNEIAERYLKCPIPPYMVGLDMDSCMYKMRVNCWNWNSFLWKILTWSLQTSYKKHLTRANLGWKTAMSLFKVFKKPRNRIKFSQKVDIFRCDSISL